MAKSNLLGRAFEYICMYCLATEIAKIRSVTTIKNIYYLRNKEIWETLDEKTKSIMFKEAMAAIPILLDLEPMIEEDEGDILVLKLQSDKEGIVGDVRDILLIR